MARRVSAREADAAPDAVLRLAVLLQAGVPPARAWRHLADAGDAAAVAVCRGCDQGLPLPAAIAAVGDSWTALARAWSVATVVGAPLADTLRGLAASLRDVRETGDQVRIALAEPMATAKLLGWLPLVAVALGAALGFDTVSTLFLHPAGVVCLVAGVGLLVVSWRWTTTLARRAGRVDASPGAAADLLSIALSGGVSLDRAQSIVSAAGGGGADPELEAVLELSRTAGVPAVELLRASASLARHRTRVDARTRAARLSSQLLLPLGVCTLPAFLLLGVAPMILGVMSTMSLRL